MVEFTAPGRIAGFRFYRKAANADTHFVVLLHEPSSFWVMDRAAAFHDDNPASDGWQNVWIRPWFRVTVGHRYKVAVFCQNGKYMRHSSILSGSGTPHGDITFWNSFEVTTLNIVDAVPTLNSHAPGIDVLFHEDE